MSRYNPDEEATRLRLLLPIVLFACNGPQPPDNPGPPVLFGFPLAEPERFPLLVGVDHDPIEQDGTILGAATCTDYNGRGFPNCYDQHDGNDYILDGDFDQMDLYPAAILAAEPGVVVKTQDGFYDKCHPDGGLAISCDGHPIEANYVIIEHDEGITSRYWHMRKDSVRVEVGDEVSCGDVIGEVGSSGKSSKPHLHFEIMLDDERVLNPYAGPYSQEQSWWAEQKEPDELPGAGCTGR